MQTNIKKLFLTCLFFLLLINAVFAQATQVPPGKVCFQATTGLTGLVGTLGTINGGSGGNSGNYSGVTLTGGTGNGATANIIVSGGVVTAVTVVQPGQNYAVNDTLSANPSDIGGVSGFSVPINSISINSSLAGGTVGMYNPGTLNFAQTWQNASQGTLNTNPIKLDLNGCALIYGIGTYRQILYDSLGNEVWDQLTSVAPVNPYWAGNAGGTANAIAVTDGSFSATAGQSINFIAAFTNTGATTLIVNGYTFPIYKNYLSGLVPLTGNEIYAGNFVSVTFNGSQFVLTTASSLSQAQSTLASATTTDLGTATTHNILITGTTTITSFGSSANTINPFYTLTFQSGLRVTYDSASMQITGNASSLFNAGDTATAEYLGSGNWRIINTFPATAPPQSVGIANAGVVNSTLVNGASPNSTISWSYTSVIVTNSSGRGLFYNTGSPLTINLGTTGPGGLDTGSLAASTWYYCYAISNGITLSNVCSLQSSFGSVTTTNISGYTYATSLGAWRTDSSGNLLRLKRVGDITQYAIVTSTNTTQYPQMALGSSGSSSAGGLTTISLANYVPPTADKIRVTLFAGAATSAAAPNNNFNAVGNVAGPPLTNQASGTTLIYGEFVLESYNIYYYGSSTATALECVGWSEPLNSQ